MLFQFSISQLHICRLKVYPELMCISYTSCCIYYSVAWSFDISLQQRHVTHTWCAQGRGRERHPFLIQDGKYHFCKTAVITAFKPMGRYLIREKIIVIFQGICILKILPFLSSSIRIRTSMSLDVAKEVVIHSFI